MGATAAAVLVVGTVLSAGVAWLVREQLEGIKTLRAIEVTVAGLTRAMGQLESLMHGLDARLRAVEVELATRRREGP